jgi:branched-chain amino acid transport system permease protein
LGLALVYGLLRILHVAHAALFTLGGYIGVLVTNATGSFALALVMAMIAVGCVGMAVYKLAYEPLLAHPPYIALIASIALFITAEEIFRIVFGPYGLSYDNPPLQGQIEVFAGFFLKYGEALVIVLSVTMLSALAWLSLNTRVGVSWRATVTDPQMARAFGVSTQNVRYLNFFVGSALAAAAGVLVALLNNLVEPTMGSVPSYKALAIIVLGGLGSIRQGLSIVPEGRRIFPDLSVEENLMIGGHVMPTAAMRRNIVAALTHFPRLKDRRRQEAGSLSGGEQQMLAMGRALISEPRLLLVDELSLGLMPSVIDECYRVLRDLRDDGLAIVLVDQNTEQALDAADNVCILEAGNLTWTGSAADARRGDVLAEAFLGQS